MDFSRSEPAVALAVGCALLALLAWLSWRKPTWLFLLALASLAIRPQLLWGGPAVGYEWGAHQTLFTFALLVSATRYGVRRTVPWSILALVAVSALNLLFGDLHRDLSVTLMLVSLALFALPFAASQTVLARGSRRVLALAIALTPLLSVTLGGLLQAAGFRAVFNYDQWTENWYRLEGATGNAAVFGMLAFAGLAVALHEWTRPGRAYAIYLAILNLALVILSGTRMAIFASAVFLGTYAAFSEGLRQKLKQQRWTALAGVGLVAAILVAYWPTLIGRIFADDGETLELSGTQAH